MVRMGYTENGSATLLESGNPCLDLFFHVVPTTPAESLISRLEAAWAHDPLTTLKLICNLRGVRGKSKADKKGFFTAALWLHRHHPRTLACNLVSFAEFGCFKDFPEILYRVLGLAHPKCMVKKPKKKKRYSAGVRGRGRGGVGFRGGRGGGRGRGMAPFPRVKKTPKEREAIIRASLAKQEKEKAFAARVRHQKKSVIAKRALYRYNRDPGYKFLHDRVSDLFSSQLRSDMESLKSGESNKVSLAAKWCPSLDSSYDRATLLCEAIARKVFPREEFKEYEGVEESHYAYRVRDRLRKEVLVPLRKALELPERFMSGRKWNELPYNRVPSVAMKTYKEFFLEHDKERFKEYLKDVASGKVKIAAGALLPHEIVAALGDIDDGEVSELQWKRMVDDMRKEGEMNDCISVCDVSGSMSGIPMEVCVSLGLLVSELAEEPWKGKVITFSAHPQMHLIKGDDLRSKTEFIGRMDWGMNTDLQKVFDLILNVAVQGEIKPEEMIKRVFIFSDMEFDLARGNYDGHYYSYDSSGNESSSNEWETDYEVIRNKFESKGYGEVVPEIVFWNLRNSRATPVNKDQKGCALVSGYSKNALKLFLEGKFDAVTPMTPESIMKLAISGDEYQKLVVFPDSGRTVQNKKDMKQKLVGLSVCGRKLETKKKPVVVRDREGKVEIKKADAVPDGERKVMEIKKVDMTRKWADVLLGNVKN